MRLCDERRMRDEYMYIKKMEEEVERKKKEILVLEALIRSSKEAIRNTLKETERYKTQYPQWRTYRDNWDSRYMREEYEGVFTPEECKDYTEANWEHWYNPWNDGRDCTGVWFTTHIDVFPLPKCNKTIVYHFQACDV